MRRYTQGETKLLSDVTWFDILNFSAAIITVIGGANFVFKKAFNRFKQRLAKLNKRIRLYRIRKLRRQYDISKAIETNSTWLISYCFRNVGAALIMLMIMTFIGFIFLYLEHGVWRLVGGFYMLIIVTVAINFFDEFADILIGLKSGENFRSKLKESLAELRIK